MATARDMVTRALRVGEGRKFKAYEKRAEAINRFEPEMELLDDAELRDEADSLRERARGGESLDDLLPEAFALTREAARRSHRPAPLRRAADRRHGPPRRRDRRDEDRRGQDADGDARRLPQHAGRRQRPRRHRQRLPRAPRRGMDDAGLRRRSASASPRSRRTTTTRRGSAKYACDVTYGTNSEFGFDYLRDNMSAALEHCVQRGHHFAIVDEVDNILIDEARTPLIISGAPEQAAQTYYTVRPPRQADGRRRSEREAEIARRIEGHLRGRVRLRVRREAQDRGADRERRETGRGVPRRRQPLHERARHPGQPPGPGAEGRVALQEATRTTRSSTAR